MTDKGVRSLVDEVRTAINRHDLHAFLECFDDTYESEQPLRPERSFRGRDGVRRNWSANLSRVPDLRWDLLDGCFTADAACCEWRWHGTRVDGARFDVQGVVIYAERGTARSLPSDPGPTPLADRSCPGRHGSRPDGEAPG